MQYKDREIYFNIIISYFRKILYIFFKLDKHKKFKKFENKNKLIPLLSYDIKEKVYYFHCYCFGCPFNNNGICCLTKHIFIPKKLIHEFDNNNIIKNVCG